MNRDALARPWWLLPLGRVHSLWWGVVVALMIWVDYVAGPVAQFPLLYAIPVILAAWYSGRWPALAMALTLPLAHIVFLLTVWSPQDELAFSIAQTIFRASVVVLIAAWFARLAEHERDIDRYVQRLEGLLSICSFCKGIRNNAGDWEPLEKFISTRSEAQFSHGMCPTCSRAHYPDFDFDAAIRSDSDLRH
jgi:K+-sensing histidine kinase KdpD